MSTFAVGDRVRLNSSTMTLFNSDVGTVTHVGHLITVLLDGEPCNYEFYPSELELLTSAQQHQSCPTCGAYPGATHGSPHCNQTSEVRLASAPKVLNEAEPTCRCQSPARHDNTCEWMLWREKQKEVL